MGCSEPMGNFRDIIMGWGGAASNARSRWRPLQNIQPTLHRGKDAVNSACHIDAFRARYSAQSVSGNAFHRADRRICRTLAHQLPSGPRMEFTVLFLAVAIVMLVAWRGPRPLALGLFAAVLIARGATYLHHAPDTLHLSFLASHD